MVLQSYKTGRELVDLQKIFFQFLLEGLREYNKCLQTHISRHFAVFCLTLVRFTVGKNIGLKIGTLALILRSIFGYKPTCFW